MQPENKNFHQNGITLQKGDVTMMKLKQILTLLTAAGMSLVNIQPVQVTMPAAALTASAANSGSCGENVTWALNNGVLTISGTGAMDDQDLPNTFSSLNFSKAVIMDGVTSIGKMSFERCFGLKSVTIPSSVTSIGFQAFYQCTSLTDITIPESVTSFAADVFNETPWLEAKQKENPLVVVNDILIDGTECHPQRLCRHTGMARKQFGIFSLNCIPRDHRCFFDPAVIRIHLQPLRLIEICE